MTRTTEELLKTVDNVVERIKSDVDITHRADREWAALIAELSAKLREREGDSTRVDELEVTNRLLLKEAREMAAKIMTMREEWRLMDEDPNDAARKYILSKIESPHLYVNYVNTILAGDFACQVADVLSATTTPKEN